MELTFQIPGKSFVLGEYAVLKSAPALVFCHEPYYVFHISDHSGQGMKPIQEFFHPDSPAGFLNNHSPMQKAQVFISGRHEYGLGGFGLSTAEFWLAHRLLRLLTHSDSPNFLSAAALPVEVDQLDLLQSYWRVFDEQKKNRPSGADLQAQSKGGLCYVDQSQGVLKKVVWPFNDLSLIVVATGQKLKTHEHLEKFQRFDFDGLVQLSHKIQGTLDSGSSTQFVELVRRYGHQLEENGLLAPATKEMMAELQTFSGVLAVKGCGAMGADSMLVVVRATQKEQLLQSLKNKGWIYFDSPGQGGFVI